MKIVLVHDYSDAFRRTRAWTRLKDHEAVAHTDAYTDPARLVAQAAGCEALLLIQQRIPLPRQAIERLPALRFISQTGRNVSHLDLTACTERGILVSASGVAGGSPYSSTGELAWGLILAALRHLPYEIERLKQGHWQSTVGTRLAGRTLGIYAFGHIGGAVARVGRAFGMKVVCWGREGSMARARGEGFEVAASREAFFESADVLSLHIPSNKDTLGIVTAADLARMKPTALLVNTSRAPIIAAGALVAALEKGRPGFAAVDVYEQEPLVGGDHPLLKMKNALCTPHLGYAESDTYETLAAAAVEQLLAYAAGKPVNVINPEGGGQALGDVRRDGFTMVEMLAVLAVIAILALMAVPSFQDQILRDQIREGLPLADIAKRPVELSWALTQALPADNAAAALPAAEKIVNNQVRAVEVKNGAVHVTFGNRASTVLAGKVLSLRPAVVEDAPVVPVTWVCGYAEAPDKMTIKGDNRTDVPMSFLPAACRARTKS